MYYFFLGNTPELSRLEIESLISGDLQPVLPGILAYEGQLDITKNVSFLGGTRKLAEQKLIGPKADVITLLTSVLAVTPNKNVAITDYAKSGLNKGDLHQLKTAVNRPLRFVSMETTEHELILLAHQHVAELNILPVVGDETKVSIATTTWIFDAEDWIHRDRNKPYRDIKRGMLPPKLARILVNLATGGKDRSLYDPFCGTGTVLTEALIAGVRAVYGSDTNPDAITGTQANLDWAVTTYQLPSINVYLKQADVSHPPFESVDSIATEPYMGPLLDDRNPRPLDKLKDIAKGLDKLYRGAFKAWYNLLPEGGRVVMTIPSFAVYGRVIPTIRVDSITSLGYNYISSVAYGKPGAAVIRNITVLEKK